MTVESVRLRLLLVAPLRLVLGIAFLGAARAVGGASGATLVAFAVGAFAMAFLVPNDRRARFLRSGEPARLSRSRSRRRSLPCSRESSSGSG